ncbi:MAG TPA: hypothetical protein VFY65_21030 [Longimicrobium sp.]|nr:hypothetical protein [Longimicrobium sp.]
MGRGNHLCPMVPERWYGKHNGPGQVRIGGGLLGLLGGNGSPGLVTTGAGPCLVAVVHDSSTDTGCMAHITEVQTDGWSFRLADEIIEHMIIHLIGFQPAQGRIQVILMSGSVRFRRYREYLQAEGHLGQCEIVDRTGNNEKNYAYYPARGEIYPLDRVDADSMSAGQALNVRPYTLDAQESPDSFLVNFHDRWATFVNNYKGR